MKIYKTEPDKYGWYWVIHECKGYVKIYMKCEKEVGKENEKYMNIYDDGFKLLKDVFANTREQE